MNMIRQVTHKKINGGFTLIETLVATTIVVSATVGPLALAGRSLAQANYIRDQITATYLVQEGLEIMRNVRDIKGMSGPDPLNLAILKGTCSSGCKVSGVDSGYDTSAGTYKVEACGGDSCILNYDSTTNIYSYDGSVKSIFKRVINIDEKVPNIEYKVKVAVTWNRAGSHTIQISENLFDRTW